MSGNLYFWPLAESRMPTQLQKSVCQMHKLRGSPNVTMDTFSIYFLKIGCLETWEHGTTVPRFSPQCPLTWQVAPLLNMSLLPSLEETTIHTFSYFRWKVQDGPYYSLCYHESNVLRSQFDCVSPVSKALQWFLLLLGLVTNSLSTAHPVPGGLALAHPSGFILDRLLLQSYWLSGAPLTWPCSLPLEGLCTCWCLGLISVPFPPHPVS